jgi:hypothetical protein
LLAISSIGITFSQVIPDSDAYLGQTPPGTVRQKFNLSVISGCFASDRIAISPDGKEIYYSEIRGFSWTNYTVRYFKYSNGAWSTSQTLFENYLAPALSTDGNRLYLEAYSNNYTSHFSERNSSGWNTPTLSVFLTNPVNQHYLQVTNSGEYYSSSTNSIKWLGGGDFYISRDESYIILASPNKGGYGNADLFISYRKNDASWTNPKNLGQTVNSSDWDFGPYVSADNKYLFYSSGNLTTNLAVYWVRVDNIIDSLKRTNFIPYVKTKMKNQTGKVGESFTFTIPDSTFIDDDGNSTLTCDVTSRLPAWLSFDPETNRFDGIPTETGTLNITVKAIDPEGASASNSFSLKIEKASGSPDQPFEQSFRLFPNPAKELINLSFGTAVYKEAFVSITNIIGKEVYSVIYRGNSSATIDLSGHSAGLYFLKIDIDGDVIIKKIVLE